MMGRQGREYHVFILHREMLFSALRLFFPKVGRPGEIKAGIDGERMRDRKRAVT